MQADNLAGNYQRLSSHKDTRAPMIEGTHYPLPPYPQWTYSRLQPSAHARPRLSPHPGTVGFQQKTQMSDTASSLRRSTGRAMNALLTRSKMARTLSYLQIGRTNDSLFL